MNPTMNRRQGLMALGGLALLGAGCTSVATLPAEEGRYCHRTGRSYRPRSTCTTEPVPGPAVQADARRLGGVADRLTVYVIRQRWNDASGLLTLTAADRAAVELLPGSFARLRLPPGHYRLRLDSAGEAGALDIGGLAGEVRVLEVDSEVWAWRRSDRLREVRADTQLERVSRLPLVADVR